MDLWIYTDTQWYWQVSRYVPRMKSWYLFNCILRQRFCPNPEKSYLICVMFVNCGLPEFETRDSSCVKSCQTRRNERLKRGRGPGHPSFEHGISRRQRKCWNEFYYTCFFLNFVSRTKIVTRFGCEIV